MVRDCEISPNTKHKIKIPRPLASILLKKEKKNQTKKSPNQISPKNPITLN